MVEPENLERTILAIDVGTSSLKAVLYTPAGRLSRYQHSQRYTYRSEKPGWAEGDPEEWWQACRMPLADLTGQGFALEQIRSDLLHRADAHRRPSGRAGMSSPADDPLAGPASGARDRGAASSGWACPLSNSTAPSRLPKLALASPPQARVSWPRRTRSSGPKTISASG